MAQILHKKVMQDNDFTDIRMKESTALFAQ